MHPDDGQPIDRLVQWALRRREVYPAEYRTRRADGGYTWWEERGAPTAFRDGRPVRWVGVIRNMILSPGPALVVDSTFVAGPGDRVGTTPTARPGGAGDTTATTLANAERQHVLRACKARGWRIKGPGAAAERLGLNASTLYFRMKNLGITRPSGLM
jgi:hypothetical protein